MNIQDKLFQSLTSEEEILNMVSEFVENNKMPANGDSEFDINWIKAEKALLNAMCLYVYYKYPTKERTFSKVYDALNDHQIQNLFELLSDPYIINSMDVFSDEIFKNAIENFKIFKSIAGKHYTMVRGSCVLRIERYYFKK